MKKIYIYIDRKIKTLVNDTKKKRKSEESNKVTAIQNKKTKPNTEKQLLTYSKH